MARTLIRNITGMPLTLPLPYGGVLPGGAATVVPEDEQVVLAYLGGPDQIRFLWDVFPVNENTLLGPITVAGTGFTGVRRALGQATQAVYFNNQRLTGVGTPGAVTDAANRAYVDSLIAGRVPTSRNVNAGFALTGGGPLTGDITLGFGISPGPNGNVLTSDGAGAWISAPPSGGGGGAVGGDLSGTTSNATVIRLQNRVLSSATPTASDYIRWNNSTQSWEPGVVDKLHDKAVSSANPTNGQVLTWNGATSQWTPATPTGGTFSPQMQGTVLNASVTTISPVETVLGQFPLLATDYAGRSFEFHGVGFSSGAGHAVQLRLFNAATGLPVAGASIVLGVGSTPIHTWSGFTPIGTLYEIRASLVPVGGPGPVAPGSTGTVSFSGVRIF